MKKHRLYSGAIALSVGAILAKIFSAIHRVLLTRILGGVGIGIYQLIFPLYALCVVLATSGIPLAISKVISKNAGKEKSVLKKSLLYTSIISLSLCFILLLFSEPLAKIQGQTSISICYIILAPTIIIVGVCSVLRGYFQGKQNFIPSAVSNVIEQFVKLSLGLGLSILFLKYSLTLAIIGTIVGIAVSEVVSLIVLLCYFRQREKNENDTEVSTKELLKDIFPIALTNLILPIASFIDSILVVNVLAINFTKSMSVFMYGLESGAVGTLIGLPTIFSFSIASVLLPNLTISSKQSIKRKIEISLKLIYVITIPCALAFVFFPNRIIDLLYSNRLNAYGVEGLNMAYRLLIISSVGCVFLSTNQLFSICLQSIDERMVTIRNLTIAVVIKFLIEIIFMPSRIVNIYALALSNTLCYIISSVLNQVELSRHFSMKFDYVFFSKLVVANVIMFVTIALVLAITNSVFNTILAILIGGTVYLFAVYFLKIFSHNELNARLRV